MRAIRRPGRKRFICEFPVRRSASVFYGIDFPTSEELIAHNRTVDQVAAFLEVDSLAYLSMEGCSRA